MATNRIWIEQGRYFYSPHPKYEGIFELYFVDQNNIEHCLQNFCLEESAIVLVKEDKAWKKSGSKLSRRNNIDWAIDLDNMGNKSIKSFIDLESDLEEKKRQARKRRREARKNKEGNRNDSSK